MSLPAYSTAVWKLQPTDFFLSTMASLLSFSLPKPNIIKASSATPTTTTLPIPVALDEKFGRKGIKFLESNNIPFVELTEILYTVPAGGADSTKAKGGIGLVINDASEKSSKGSLLSGSEWTVKDADNDAIDALQILSRRSFKRWLQNEINHFFINLLNLLPKETS
ncbi:hypothetical protein CRYUN_Cryun05aG0018700 [Craigia yunnanensis]